MTLADTGFFLALANRADRSHAAAVKALKTHKPRLVTTWSVMTETCYLLLTRLGHEAELRFIDSYAAEAFEVLDLERKDTSRLRELMEKYRDLPMDLADASLVIAAERLGHGDILSTDERDFGVYRWKNYKPFRNLMLKHR